MRFTGTYSMKCLLQVLGLQTLITAWNKQALDVRKSQRSTAKLVKTNIENIWAERSAETKVH